ncbi:MAG: fibronectin type III domain-containing protein [Bacteroidaceae bacterium]
MNFKYLLLSVFGFSSLSYGAEDPFDFVANKNIITDTLPSKKIDLGEHFEIFGKTQSKAGIYLKDNGSTYTAQRLSVVPPASFERWKPYLQVPTSNSIIVSWKTTSSTKPSVSYGISAAALNLSSEGANEELATNYIYNKVKLEGLTPDTKYFYKISGDETIYSFRTQPEIGNNRNYRVLLVGDHQIVNRSGYTWLLNAARETIEKKYGPMEDNIDLILNPGDQVDRGTYDYYERCHFFKSFDVSPYFPIMTTAGNHEFIDDPNIEKYAKFFSYENISYKGISSNTDAYYAFQEGRTLFIVLCTESLFTKTNAQKDWLKSVLTAANTDSTVDFVMSMCHRPICSETYITDFSPWLKDIIVPILGSCPKHVMNISAHHHYYQRGQVLDYPFYHIISGGASWDQTWDMAPTKFDNNLVQKTHDYWTYQIINFNSATKKMDVETYSIGNRNIVHNNILIDKFSRNLSFTDKPEKPILANIPEQLNLPAIIASSAYKSSNIADFNSCQFQISSSEDFNAIVIDKVLHFENFFEDSGKSLYLPINTQKNKSCFELALSEKEIATGRYFVRVRHRNQNMNWSEWSDTKKFFTVTKEQSSISLETNLFTTEAGNSIDVTFKSVPVGTKAWIGIYTRNAVIGKDASTKFAYTEVANGVTKFYNTPVGKYQVVLFGTGGYDIIAPKIEIEVINGNIGSISSDKSQYAVQEPVRISYNQQGGFSNDWIGIYSLGKRVGSSDVANIYKYVLSDNYNQGTLIFKDETKLPAGNYFAILLSKGGYQETTGRIYFSIGNNPQMVSSKDVYKIGEYVELNISQIGPFPLCWLLIKDATTNQVIEKSILNTANPNIAVYKNLAEGNYTAELKFPNSEFAASNKVSFSVNKEGSSIALEKQSIGCYPNPVIDILNISYENVIRAELYTLGGSLVFVKENIEKQLNLSEIPIGYYQLKLYTPTEKHIISLLKK